MNELQRLEQAKQSERRKALVVLCIALGHFALMVGLAQLQIPQQKWFAVFCFAIFVLLLGFLAMQILSWRAACERYWLATGLTANEARRRAVDETHGSD